MRLSFGPQFCSWDNNDIVVSSFLKTGLKVPSKFKKHGIVFRDDALSLKCSINLCEGKVPCAQSQVTQLFKLIFRSLKSPACGIFFILFFLKEASEMRFFNNF